MRDCTRPPGSGAFTPSVGSQADGQQRLTTWSNLVANDADLDRRHVRLSLEIAPGIQCTGVRSRAIRLMTQTTSAMQITAVFIGAMVDSVLPYLGGSSRRGTCSSRHHWSRWLHSRPAWSWLRGCLGPSPLVRRPALPIFLSSKGIGVTESKSTSLNGVRLVGVTLPSRGGRQAPRSRRETPSLPPTVPDRRGLRLRRNDGLPA